MLIITFWSLLVLILWTYVGYPLLLLILKMFKRPDAPGADIEPDCTLIITAYNEEVSIAKKLENSLSLDYPKTKLQIVVASDCSNDRTHEIVEGFFARGIELLVLEERGGKTAAQNAAVAVATGEVLIFTDASTEFTSSTIRSLVQPFADSRVGCVEAELDYISDGETGIGKGAGLYWKYERWVKKAEASVNSLIGVSGCLYAVRKELYSDIAPDMISDFVIASEIHVLGYRTVYAHGAVSKEKTLENTRQEFDMRVRVAVRSINALVRYAKMMNPIKHGFFSVQLVSHKLLRYLVPEMMIALLIVNSVLVWSRNSSEVYDYLLVAHLSVYVLALLGWLTHSIGIRMPMVHVPFYFVQANVAAFWALVLYIGGERKTIWTPAR